MIQTDIYNEVSERPYVATIGFFDGVHRGHRFLLERVMQEAHARQLPSLVVTFPEHPTHVLHPETSLQQLTTFAEKEHLLREAGIDTVAGLHFTPELANMSAYQFMKEVLREQLNVGTLLIGWDHKFGHNRSEGFPDYVRYGRELGIEVIQSDAWQMDGVQVSSSVVRQLLATGNLEEANRCLGYAYVLEGKVVSGHQVGRTIGFPTANLHVATEKMVPANGVYAVRVERTGITHQENSRPTTLYGMLNIGFRPTLDDGEKRTIEVHLFDFQEDLYGTTLRLHLDHRVREEQAFASLNALRQQLEKDKETVRNFYY